MVIDMSSDSDNDDSDYERPRFPGDERDPKTYKTPLSDK
jgi:hypothetical protein